MDKQQYLDQISTKRTVGGRQGSKLDAVMHSKFTWIVLGAVVLLIGIMAVGTSLGGGKAPVQDQLAELILRIDVVKAAVDTYQPNLKNSALRNDSASLSSVLGNSSSELTNYATQAYNYKQKDVKANILNLVAEEQQALEDALFKAKITGSLDRVYAFKIAYEISLIVNSEVKLLDANTNETLDSYLNSSYNSLTKLYPKFDEFTEG